jgi:hypothetical protein
MKAVIKARKLLLSGDVDGEDYRIIKSDCENKISVLEQKLSSLGDTSEHIRCHIEQSC